MIPYFGGGFWPWEHHRDPPGPPPVYTRTGYSFDAIPRGATPDLRIRESRSRSARNVDTAHRARPPPLGQAGSGRRGVARRKRCRSGLPAYPAKCDIDSGMGPEAYRPLHKRDTRGR